MVWENNEREREEKTAEKEEVEEEEEEEEDRNERLRRNSIKVGRKRSITRGMENDVSRERDEKRGWK